TAWIGGTRCAPQPTAVTCAPPTRAAATGSSTASCPITPFRADAAPRAPSRSAPTPGGTERGGEVQGGEARGALLRPCRGAGGARPGRRGGRGRGIVARRAAPFLRYRPAADEIGGSGRRVGAGRARGCRAGSRDARRRRTVRNGSVDPPAPPGGGGVCSPMFGTPNSEH